MSQEIELKLAFPASERDRVIRLLQTRGERFKPTKELFNTYYDTPDLVLGKAKVALRTRKVGEEWLQTVKCAAVSVGGLSSRPEWEQAYSGRFDFSAVAVEPRALLEQHREAIVPLFSTNFYRETFLLQPAHGVRIQAMVDLGTIEAAGLSEDICELELELETGEAEHLWSLAIELARELPLLPYDPSKAARGYRLFQGKIEEPFRSRPSGILPGMGPDKGFRILADELLQAWQANVWGVLTQSDPEFIHQLRVSLRRLRSLIRLFERGLPSDFVPTWSKELGETARLLGRSRDLKVLQDQVLGPIQTETSEACLEALLGYCERAAGTELEKTRASLWEARCGEQLLRFAQALHALPESSSGLPLNELARTGLRDLWKRAGKAFETALEAPSDEALHRLRIRLKGLRYGLEFFAPLFSGKKRFGDYQRALSSLQERLGALNDLNMAVRTAQDWARDEPSLSEGSIYLQGWRACWIKERTPSLLGECAQFLHMEPPWRKLSAKACEGMNRGDGDA